MALNRFLPGASTVPKCLWYLQHFRRPLHGNPRTAGSENGQAKEATDGHQNMRNAKADPTMTVLVTTIFCCIESNIGGIINSRFGIHTGQHGLVPIRDLR